MEHKMKDLRTCAFQLVQYENASLLRLHSPQAATFFADTSIDIVFIDGRHDHKYVLADAIAWWPKAKQIVAFHDYDMFPGVRDAVDQFCLKVDRTLTKADGDVVYLKK